MKRFFFHSHGISYQKFENLNNRISLYPQYASLKNTVGTLQFGLITERRKTSIIYSFSTGSSLSGNKETKSSSTKFIGGSVDLAYHMIGRKQISFYPLLGLGYERYSIVLRKDNSMVPFDSVLQNNNVQQNSEPLQFTNAFVVYKMGLGINARSLKHPRNSIGLQGGYIGGFNNRTWRINGTQLLFNSPKDNLSKFFFHIDIRYELLKR